MKATHADGLVAQLHWLYCALEAHFASPHDKVRRLWRYGSHRGRRRYVFNVFSHIMITLRVPHRLFQAIYHMLPCSVRHGKAIGARQRCSEDNKLPPPFKLQGVNCSAVAGPCRESGARRGTSKGPGLGRHRRRTSAAGGRSMVEVDTRFIVLTSSCSRDGLQEWSVHSCSISRRRALRCGLKWLDREKHRLQISLEIWND